MNRRQVLAAAATTISLPISGCINDPGTEGGLLEVIESGDSPPNATVTDASQIDNESIQQGLQQAHENETAEIEVSEDEFGAVAETLSNLPFYDRVKHGTAHMSGVYIQYEDAMYVAVLTPFCTDSRVRDAHSERGGYGWGGCIDKSKWTE